MFRSASVQDKLPQVFRKRLAPSEKQWHRVNVPPTFVNPGAQIAVNYGTKTKEVEVDRQGRLKLGSEIFHELELDRPSAVIVLERVGDHKYRVQKG